MPSSKANAEQLLLRMRGAETGTVNRDSQFALRIAAAGFAAACWQAELQAASMLAMHSSQVTGEFEARFRAELSSSGFAADCGE